MLVDLISEEDGREAIVGLAQALCDANARDQLSLPLITQNLVDAELSDTIIPEPGLLILFTPELRLQGFPPWQIRLTEILYVPTRLLLAFFLLTLLVINLTTTTCATVRSSRPLQAIPRPKCAKAASATIPLRHVVIHTYSK